MTTTTAVHVRREDGLDLAFVVWRFAAPMRVVSTATVGGGIGWRSWIINAQVRGGYDRVDLDDHVADLARLAALPDDLEGIGLLTAADVRAGFEASDSGIDVRASVGVRDPVWAAAPAETPSHTAGTINIVALLPVTFTDAALVNLATTATEAKTQAMFDAGLDGTGTITDAVAIVCASTGAGADDGSVERFGGPRSTFGAPLARAVHAAVLAGIRHSRSVLADEAIECDR